MAYEVQIPITGNDGKVTTFSAPADAAPLDAEITALYSAVDGLVLGVEKGSYLVQRTEKDAGSDALPASGAAQRTTKWLVRYTDGASNLRHLEIGTADHALTTPPSDYVDLTAGAGLAFKTAFEALTIAGGTPTVLSIQAVGRTG